MIWFDYVFYRISNYYITRWNDDTGEMTGITFVGLMQIMHIVLFQLLLAFSFPWANDFFFESREGKNFMHSGALYVGIIVFGLNLIRYYRFKKFTDLQVTWENEVSERRKKKGRLIAMYAIVSIVVTVGLSIYRKYYF